MNNIITPFPDDEDNNEELTFEKLDKELPHVSVEDLEEALKKLDDIDISPKDLELFDE